MVEALLAERAESFTDRDPESRPLRLEPLETTFIVDERVLRGIADVDRLPHLPMQLIEKYAVFAVQHATLKEVEDGEWFATIPGFRGVWAKEATEERALEVLREVVEDWAVLKIQHKHGDLPEVEEINLNVL